MSDERWLTKTRHADGTVAIVGNFRDEWEAQKWADRWNSITGRESAFVERATP